MFQKLLSIDIAAKHAIAAVSLAAVVIVSPALAYPLQPKTAVRPIVALEKPVDDTQAFLGLFTVVDANSTDQRNYPERIFTSAAKIEPAAASDTANAATQRSIVVAEADPYFERWQKDANERLKGEHDFHDPNPHPLAAADPNNAVVVCVAGCETTKDVVVYSAPIVPGVLPAGQFEASTSAGATPSDEGSLPCIAGCYDDSAPSRPSKRQTAEFNSRPSVVTASPAVAASIPSAHVATTPQAVAHAVKQTVHSRVASAARGHALSGKLHHVRLALAAPVKSRNQAAFNGAIVEQRQVRQALATQHGLAKPLTVTSFLPKQTLSKTASAKAALAKSAMSKTAAGGKVAVLHAWRTKVVVVKPASPRKGSQQHAVRRPKHAPRNETYASYDMF
jgi:hypothetical protein